MQTHDATIGESLPSRGLRLLPGTIRIKIHPPVETKDVTDREALIAEVRRAIASGLDDWERGEVHAR